jgi:hypothetical protein
MFFFDIPGRKQAFNVTWHEERMVENSFSAVVSSSGNINQNLPD